MDCTQFSDRLEAWLDHTLPAKDQAAAEAHAAVCPRCRELCALMSIDLEDPSVESPDDLTESILARTSGRACGRARTMLGDHVDETLDGLDRELVDAHLRECADCRVLATVLTQLGGDLPAFAELRPDAALVDDVLARTRPRPGRWAALWNRARHAGRRLFERPRIAWEAGYVGAIVVWLLFGASWSPLRATPVQALALIQRTAVDTQAAGTGAIAAIGRSVRAMSQRTIQAAAGGADSVASGVFASVSSRYRQAAEAAPDLGRHWRQFASAVLDRDLFSGADALRSLSRDAGAMLNRFLFSPVTTTNPGSLPGQRSRS